MPLYSHAFILLFLPLTLFLYYTLCKTPRRKMIFLLVASACFYMLAGWNFVFVLLGLSLFTYWAGRKNWFTLGIIINLGMLVLFKYWNFGLENFNFLMKFAHLGFAAQLLSLGLPLGISFFTFKHIGYLLDVKAGRYSPSDDPWAFMAFSAYFPQIGAGPICGFNDIARQFSDLPPQLESSQARTGLIYLSFGLIKKVLIADQIGQFLASSTNTVGGFSGFLPSWYMVIAYTLQLYFDFTGYTDMALGVSALFGIKLPPNFNSPYLASNPREFWERWHISLSMWFRYYLFSPLSRLLLKKWGSTHRDLAQYSANLWVMSLVGLWHGAGWGYILWGVYHGFLLNLYALWKQTGRSIPAWVSRPLFLLSILIGWALFMSPNQPYLNHLFIGLTGLRGLGSPVLLKLLWQNNATLVLAVAIPLALSGYSEAGHIIATGRGQAAWQIIVWGVLAALSLLLLQNNIDFFYVQF